MRDWLTELLILEHTYEWGFLLVLMVLAVLALRRFSKVTPYPLSLEQTYEHLLYDEQFWNKERVCLLGSKRYAFFRGVYFDIIYTEAPIGKARLKIKDLIRKNGAARLVIEFEFGKARKFSRDGGKNFEAIVLIEEQTFADTILKKVQKFVDTRHLTPY
jgi:hypothetical protein